MNELILTDVEAGYKGTDVLRGISVTLRPGSCIAVLGPNGAGKSTLLKTISGQLNIRAGARVLDGADTTSWRTHRVARAGVRWIGDPRPVYTTLTVEENLEIGASTLRKRASVNRDRVYELLPVLHTKRADKAGSLSGGQQQMLAIGQALMSEPRYLCLDEPSLGLAAKVISELSVLIGQLAASGVGVIWAEQYPDVALKRSTEAIVLGAGKIVLQGPPASISREDLEKAYLGQLNPTIERVEPA